MRGLPPILTLQLNVLLPKLSDWNVTFGLRYSNTRTMNVEANIFDVIVATRSNFVNFDFKDAHFCPGRVSDTETSGGKQSRLAPLVGQGRSR